MVSSGSVGAGRGALVSTSLQPSSTAEPVDAPALPSVFAGDAFAGDGLGGGGAFAFTGAAMMGAVAFTGAAFLGAAFIGAAFIGAFLGGAFLGGAFLGAAFIGDFLFAGFAFGLAFAVATGFFDDPLDFTLDDFAIGSVVASKARYRQITPVADEPFPESMCHRCVHLRVIKSGKGSVFLMCQEPSLPKYPPQPVRLCRLFTPT